MLEIVKKRISLTQGDDASIWLRPKYKDQSVYVAQAGDKAYFRIKATNDVLEIECTVNVDANKIVVSFVPSDTKDMLPGIYRYEAELVTSWGMHYTFLADQTFILGKEIEKRVSNGTGTNGNHGNNLPSVDGELEDEPVIDGDLQPTNPSLDYETLNHLPKINGNTLIGNKSNEQLGIPTKTSNLDNDSDFVSDAEYVHTDNNYDDTDKGKVDALGTASTYDVAESGNASTSQVVKGDDTRLTDARPPVAHQHSKVDISDFPTNVSAFNNDSGYITNAVNTLINYYLKSETYTKTEVEQLIAAIKQGKFEVVETLPVSPDPNVIYLVPKDPTQTSNAYDEYVYINNAWEKIGDTDIDLSDYVTDEELTTALQNYVTTSAFQTAIANYYTKTETDNLLSNKVDKVSGKGLSTNDYDNTAKGIVDGVTTALAGKVDKVPGKGLSTEDYTTAEKTKLAAISDEANKVTSSSTNGHINIDGVDTTVYDDTAVTTAISGLNENVEDIQDELSTDTSTVEGNPINFSTKSAQTAQSTIIDLEPIQDLHGYDKPWVGGADVNLFRPGEAKTFTDSGITFTSDGNGRYTVKGTCTNDVYGTFDCEEYSFPDGSTHTLGFMNSQASPGGQGIDFCFYNGSTQQDFWGLNVVNRYYHGYSALSNKTVNKYSIYVKAGITVDMTLSPFVVDGSSPMTNFRPYKNECPISGRTEIGILGTNGKESTDPDYVVSNDLTISLGQTVYGCHYSVENGVLVVDRKTVTNLPFVLPTSKDNIDRWNCSALLGTTSDILQSLFGKGWAVTTDYDFICDKLQKKLESDCVEGDYSFSMYGHSQYVEFRVRIPSDKMTDAETQTFAKGCTFVYYIEPITIQLTPHQISLLEGVNNISTDGDKITLTYRDGSVATLGDLTSAVDSLDGKIEDSKILTDTATGDKYRLVVTSGVLSIEQVSN